MRIRSKLVPLEEKDPPVNSFNISDASCILIFDYLSDDELDTIINFVEEAKKSINVKKVVLINKSRNLSVFEIDELFLKISLNDISLAGGFKKHVVDWLENNKYDILLTFVESNELLFDRIIQSINADFKAGLHKPDNLRLFDLTINTSTTGYNDKLKHYIHYLTNLKINR